MSKFDVKLISGLIVLASIVIPSTASAQVQKEQTLKVVYPPTNHQTTSARIFFIGTAPSPGQVLINGQPINRSQSGHFAPSLPLKLGENLFKITYENQEILLVVTRLNTQPEVPQGVAFAVDSLTPATEISLLRGELICFSAIAPPLARVSVNLGPNQNLALLPQPVQVELPSNLAALTGTNQPQTVDNAAQKYVNCTIVESAGQLGKPTYTLNLNGQSVTQQAPGAINILSPARLPVVEVTADAGVARTGPATTYSRLTPLPRGTRASVTGSQGEWLRLDYGAWIKAQETRPLPNAIPPRTVIRSVGSRQLPDSTEITFPLEVPVPLSVVQTNDKFTLNLYNTIAQTDIIPMDDNPLISRLDWQQINPTTVQYDFNIKPQQQWGYKLRYSGTSLVLKLRHSPVEGKKIKGRKPLSGIKILIDPGHGGQESGATGPTGMKEKEVNLMVSRLLRQELQNRGANVVMTRSTDVDVSLGDRQKIISQSEPAIALSIHYNALPDYGNAEKTKGVGIFWYHPQAHSLAVFLHNYLVKKLNRPSYGVFWNNLALTRPEAAPSVLLELGFMSNPEEFEWVSDPKQQRQLADTLAEAIVKWFQQQRGN